MSLGRAGGQGVGASILRKEDARHLHGRGQFVSDMILPGQREVAFLRSPLAHARILGVRKPAGSEGKIFVRGDLAEVKPIVNEVERWLLLLADTGSADEKRTATRERMLADAMDPEFIAHFRDSMARKNPEYAQMSDAEIREGMLSMTNKIDNITPDEAAERWAHLELWRTERERWVSDAAITADAAASVSAPASAFTAATRITSCRESMLSPRRMTSRFVSASQPPSAFSASDTTPSSSALFTRARRATASSSFGGRSARACMAAARTRPSLWWR